MIPEEMIKRFLNKHHQLSTVSVENIKELPDRQEIMFDFAYRSPPSSLGIYRYHNYILRYETVKQEGFEILSTDHYLPFIHSMITPECERNIHDDCEMDYCICNCHIISKQQSEELEMMPRQTVKPIDKKLLEMIKQCSITAKIASQQSISWKTQSPDGSKSFTNHSDLVGNELMIFSTLLSHELRKREVGEDAS